MLPFRSYVQDNFEMGIRKSVLRPSQMFVKRTLQIQRQNNHENL